jgi:hypothetical protein
MKPDAHRTCAENTSLPMDEEVPMLFPSRPATWDNRDYRVYCDHRTRQKRRLRLRMFIDTCTRLESSSFVFPT